ncbi:hypothetical protein HK104_008731 [Borealophlyctis nickersoniae]|nr:hypothetical protein HK104_008731 [Borealophlyctis nickersoniae]
MQLHPHPFRLLAGAAGPSSHRSIFLPHRTFVSSTPLRSRKDGKFGNFKIMRDLTPKPPTLEQLNAPKPPPKFSYPQPVDQTVEPTKPKPRLWVSPSGRTYRRVPNGLGRIPSANAVHRVWPTTFGPEGNLRQRPRIPAEPLPESERGKYGYPYRYYEVHLKKGLIGLPWQTRKKVKEIGFRHRNDVIWRRVNPISAGHILRIRDLVSVRLVNEIPGPVVIPKGFKKVGNMLGLPEPPIEAAAGGQEYAAAKKAASLEKKKKKEKFISFKIPK